MPNLPIFHTKSLLLHWLVCGLLGLILAPLGFHVFQLEYFEKWHAIALAPPGAVEILYGYAGFGGEPDGAIIRTEDGEILGWDIRRDRWVPSVVREEQTIASCDQFQVAFNPLARSPQDIAYCTAFQGEFRQGHYTTLYAIDQQGTLWGWQKVIDVYHLLRYPVFAAAGGILGTLVGCVVWAVRRLRAMRISGNTPTQPDHRFTKTLIGLMVILPFICIGVITLWLEIQWTPPNRQREPIYTSVASTLSVYETAEAAQYQTPPTTPDPSGPAYDFSAQCPSAEWSGKGETWSCADNRPPWQASVTVIEAAEAGQAWTGQALRLYLPIRERNAAGRYPVWKIRPGDHFRASAICPGENVQCSLIFGLRIEQDGEGTEIGEWSPTDDQRSVEIDVDLSEFAGEHVVFVLWTENYTWGRVYPVEQVALWVNPRIEQVP